MSRQDDERELRKLEYLKRRGVATFSDELRRKELARKMASEDFDSSELSKENARELAMQRYRKLSQDGNKGDTN